MLFVYTSQTQSLTAVFEKSGIFPKIRDKFLNTWVIYFLDATSSEIFILFKLNLGKHQNI